MKITVQPRDLKAGDLLDFLTPDLDTEQQAVESIEKTRRGNHTAYVVHFTGGHKPALFQPTAKIAVERAGA